MVRSVKKKRKGIATYASYTFDEWPFTQAAGQTDKSAPLTASATLKIQPHPLVYDIFGLSFKNLLSGKVWSCDS